MKQREGLLEARRQQQQRTGRQALRTSKSGVQPPPGWVRVIPGSPTDRLGFIKDMTWQVSEDQEPSRACYVDGQRESDSKIEDKKYDLPDTDRGQQEAQWENPQWPGSDDAGNHEPQWENPRWLSPNDGGNLEEAYSGDHLWRRPHTTRPLSPAAPGRLRKDSIGPPTNFHHVLHIDRHSTEHELQQLMANLNKEAAPLKTHKSLPDLVEHGGNQDTGHRTTDLPWPTGASVPPAGIRKDMIGQPTNFQHVTHVGFGDKRSVGVSEELQQQQDPTTAFSLPKLTSWNGHYLSDPETQNCTSDGVNEHRGQQTHLKSQPWSYHDGECPEEENHRQDHQYSIPGVDGGQQVAQETHQWSIPGEDGGQQVAQETHQWSIPHPEDDPSSSLAQTPSWLRKDMIGPPTNFQHIFHLDRDNIDQEIQQMLREVGVDLQPLSDSKTQRVANDVTERQRGQEEASGRSTTLRDLPDPAKPGRIRKDMIGPPTNFQHVSHVGLSSTTAWQVTED
ncbi:uncharacterized protein [Panulirus ornatus]|uniref:uncharacterized protein isoform X2 n=1 Tax=Panulirus ornatus TaxID=150431 RepID=UPI003A86A4A4